MFYYLCRIINVTATILYPTYASYKALKSTTTSSSTTSNSSLTSSSSAEQQQQQTKELERWTRYWCVIGLVWIYQDWFEWSFNWLPFYFEFKTLFLLWTVLPQIQGSTYLYEFHLSPLIRSHESKIDQLFGNLNQKFKSFGLEVFKRLVKNLRSLILGDQEAVVSRGNYNQEEGGEGGLKSLLSWVLTTTTISGGRGNANSGNDDETGNFLRVATRALLQPPTNSNPTGGGRSERGESKLRKKQRLERELAALNYSTSTSSSSSSDDDDVQEEEDEEGLEDEDEEDSSLLGVPRFSNSSSSSCSTSNLSKTRLRKPRSRGGENGRRYVESKLEGGSKESVYEDLGSFETRRELEDYPSKNINSAGWFGWGGTPNRGKVQNQKGKRD